MYLGWACKYSDFLDESTFRKSSVWLEIPWFNNKYDKVHKVNINLHSIKLDFIVYSDCLVGDIATDLPYINRSYRTIRKLITKIFSPLDMA